LKNTISTENKKEKISLFNICFIYQEKLLPNPNNSWLLEYGLSESATCDATRKLWLEKCSLSIDTNPTHPPLGREL